MTDTTKDGGPAFPITGETSDAVNAWPFNGMTLRDYFAGQALAGIFANKDAMIGTSSAGKLAKYEFDDAIAMVCYGLADAMLKARGEK